MYTITINSKVEYVYKTYRGVFNRLIRLAQNYNNDNHLVISVQSTNRYDEKLELFNTEYAYGWQTRVNRGIPRNDLLNSACSAWSITHYGML